MNQIDIRQTLLRGFDYDKWANGQWLRAVGGYKDMGRAQQVLEHILSSQKAWLERCGVTMMPQEEDISLADLFAFHIGAWQMLLTDQSGDTPISYRTNDGTPYTHALRDIAMHVLNHGTYHRGQLRGLAQSEGFAGFPETDFILYLREHGA